MLRKRSRVTSSKEALMADYSSVPSPTDKFRNPNSFPRLFTGFTFKNLSETAEGVMSPTSILDSKPFSGFRNPFLPDPTPNPTPKTPEFETRRTWDKLDSKGIGLGIVDALNGDKTEPNLSKPESRMVLFGSQLKIQVPPLPPFLSPTDQSPKSPADFGIKTRNSQLGSFSSGLFHSPVKKSLCSSANSGVDNTNSPPRVFTGCLSASEMELSEDYTCVISYGPNPRTTHIFDDCIVESCCGVVGFSASMAEANRFLGNGSSYPSENFLSFCYACKKNLGQGKDIYMYRGEKAFCSRECRYQEMLLEEQLDKLEAEDVYGTCS
ncbi:hypothetical protein JCGZ_02192 [Jatropha curcas]|uniref:FLZ-type domain-containing protein n=1 Tax=Jatropha curcas TaxID=180498 RepID=A0A067L7Z5_JATCU|nr:FCS-Like Zinc finger 8 [Jatropha curcas]XP_012069659.1 FCS-Like Zinc finger 8 [Jatropha curcas]XP_012069660.1 FCS-Like Zinc finger 8 [Jatropha curcas]XP_012069661.1 FCS-Like Zinc finger 8 [Jatropha curcas]XP_012069662.1 FCS-Like Zinc finger 8 [Jatropha curcas]XP_037491306.1 FCS-Like Zinc finger 8 [Jatropha curcas]KDP40194.1 hypothetical protein JCGZ_02192 [Jatropha curcas]